MSYATQQNLIDRYGAQELQRLTDRATPRANAIDDTVVAGALASAEAAANSYLAVRMTTPVDPVPLALTDAVCDIARYKLFTSVPPQEVKDRNDAAVKWLAQVGAGTAALGDQGAPTKAPSPGAPKFSGAERRFTPRSMRDF